MQDIKTIAFCFKYFMMKTIHKLSIAVMLMLACATACKKDDRQIVYQGGTAPVLTVSAGAQVKYADTGKTAVTLAWTNPNYQFNTGVSSLDVSYNVQIDTTSAFSSANKKVISVSKDLSYSLLVQDLNDIMLNQLMLDTNVTYTLYMRVVSNLTNNSAQLVSNTVQLVSTPYAIPPKVAPPASGELYLVGSATAGGWGNPVPVPTQQFTQVNKTLYQLTVSLIGGQEYLFLPVNGDWSHKYAVPNKAVNGLNSGGDFGLDLKDNFPGPSASGMYKITVNFQTGRFSVVAQ